MREWDNDEDLRFVRERVKAALDPVAWREAIAYRGEDLSGGKMLRARLLLCLGRSAGTPVEVCRTAAAAVEMAQLASLLHDDVLDAGMKRRGAPAFWVSHGIRAAVLLGDTLLSVAFRLILERLPQAASDLAEAVQDMCRAEMTQNFHMRAETGAWDDCLDIARRKTGSLFGFAARCAAGDRTDLAEPLRQAGETLGIVYQLADDLLDGQAETAASDKTLGTDARQRKLTAARFLAPAGSETEQTFRRLLASSADRLEPWPAIRHAWDAFVQDSFLPALPFFFASAPE